MITTVSACKGFANIEPSNTEHDAELERLILAVESFLQRKCYRKFSASNVTEVYHGREWINRLVLARPPINSIASLYDDCLKLFVTPIDPLYYDIDDAEAGIVLLDGLTFQNAYSNVQITYNGGFVQTPADIEQAAIEMVWAAREKGRNNLVGVRSRSVADGNVQYINLDWDALSVGIVAKYKLKTGLA